MTRFLTLLLLALCALLTHGHALSVVESVDSNDRALRGAAPLPAALPVLALDEAASRVNDTAPAAVQVPVATKKPVPEPAATSIFHPIFALIMVALVLCVTNNVAEADTIAAISSTAGILTTIYALIMDLNLPAAIALSVVTIAGGNLGTFVDNVRESARDVAARPLIDWDVLLIMQPTLILGVVIGVFVRNWLVPAWILSTVLATMLLVCGSLLLQASQRRTDAEQPEGWSINEGSSLVANKPPSSGPPPPFNVAVQSVPLNKIGALVGVVVGVAVLHAALVVAVPVVLLGYLAYKSYKKTADTLENQQVPRPPAPQGELKWTTYVVRTMPIFSTLSGVATGMIGFGSDLIIAPYLVESGLDRPIAAATGATVVLLASLMTGMECIVIGSVSFTIVTLALIIGFVVREWGHIALQRGLSENLHTPHFLAVAFAVCTLIAGVALAIVSF